MNNFHECSCDEKKIGEGDHDEAYTVLYPFTFHIRAIEHPHDRYVAVCSQLPGIIMQVESLEHLKAEAIQVIDGWFEIGKQERTKTRNEV